MTFQLAKNWKRLQVSIWRWSKCRMYAGSSVCVEWFGVDMIHCTLIYDNALAFSNESVEVPGPSTIYVHDADGSVMCAKCVVISIKSGLSTVKWRWCLSSYAADKTHPTNNSLFRGYHHSSWYSQLLWSINISNIPVCSIQNVRC